MATQLASPLARLLAGNGLAQGLQLASVFVLSRMYAPRDFGILAQVQSVATALAVVETLQLHLALPLLSSSASARRGVFGIRALGVVISLISLPFALVLGWPYVCAVVLALGVGFSNSQVGYLTHQGNFGLLARFYIRRAAAIVALQMLGGWLHVSQGLLVGAVAGEWLASLFLARRAFGWRFAAHVSLRQGLALARKFPTFSLYGTIQELISVAAFYAPVLLFAERFDEATAGQYSMASRLVWAPVVLLGGSLAQILYHRLGRRPTIGLRELYRELYPPALVIAGAVLCVLSFPLRTILPHLLGSQWQLASQMLPIHVVWGGIFLLSVPVRALCRTAQLQHLQLIVDGTAISCLILLFTVVDVTAMQTMWTILIIATVQNSSLVALVARRRRNLS